MADVQELSVIPPSGGINERCPLQARCERTCIYQGHELDCPYYAENGKDEYTIADQEERRRQHTQSPTSGAIHPPEGHECVTGLNPHGFCGAASYCTEERRCCIGCPKLCNIRCGYIPSGEPAASEEYTSMIRMIPTEALYPHPDNPRKAVGDVTELAESIRKNGVLQNLTVVPVDEVEAVLREHLDRINQAHSEEELPPHEAYVVVIGHRRLAAAKQAGVEQVPCAVVSMTQTQQVRTMLEENMHREDLTVYEQAQGFQMMLDLGETLETIAKESGFSTTTVRRRLNLLKLDPEKFKASEARGATLTDYMELDKIRDPDTRNQVLDKIGTASFKNELAKAMEQEKRQEIISGFVNAASVFAAKVDKADYAAMEHVCSYDTWNSEKTVETPEDAEEINYYYVVGNYGITIYRDKQEHQETPEEIRQRELREAAENLKAQLAEIRERHFDLRKRFVSDFLCGKKTPPAVMIYAAETMMSGEGSCDTSLLADVLGVEVDVENERDDNPLESISTLREYLGYIGRPRSEAGVLLCVAYASTDGEKNGYWGWNWNASRGVYEYPHEANPGLDRLYQLLVSLGYEMSEEEKKMQDGTHPLFQTGVESEVSGDGGE